MSRFVDECRQEWKRLGVADSIADEMAADLEADLDEAAADGVAAEEVLGTDAFDARSFAASWATERGLIGPMPAAGRPRRLAPVGLVLILAGVALMGAALVTAGSRAALAALPPPLRLPLIQFLPIGLIPRPLVGGESIANFGVHAGGASLLLLGILGIVAVALRWTRRRA